MNQNLKLIQNMEQKKLYKDSTRCQFNVLLKSTRNNNIHFRFIK